MKFVVLAAADSWYLRDLTRAAADQHQIVGMSFTDVVGRLGPNSSLVTDGDERLRDADAVLVRTMPPGSLEQVVFRMDALAELGRSGTIIVNSPRAIEIAVDKYLASAKLAAAGLLIPRTAACQTVDAAMLAFNQLGGDTVVKPLFGGEGHGITRVSDENLALRAFKMLAQLNAVIYQQQFIEHEGYDIRLFVLGDRVLGMRRVNPHDWRTNVSRGATTEPFPVDEHFAKLARAATQAVGTSVAGVDILPGRDGNLYALEVNAVPGWKALGGTLDLDVAKLMLDHVESLVRRQREK
jgi:ribosomal protein S6--L-glutamate ligase